MSRLLWFVPRFFFFLLQFLVIFVGFFMLFLKPASKMLCENVNNFATLVVYRHWNKTMQQSNPTGFRWRTGKIGPTECLPWPAEFCLFYSPLMHEPVHMLRHSESKKPKLLHLFNTKTLLADQWSLSSCTSPGVLEQSYGKVQKGKEFSRPVLALGLPSQRHCWGEFTEWSNRTRASTQRGLFTFCLG